MIDEKYWETIIREFDLSHYDCVPGHCSCEFKTVNVKELAYAIDSIIKKEIKNDK